MPNGGPSYPAFLVNTRPAAKLLTLGCDPHVCYAVTALEFLTGDISDVTTSPPLTFRLDTAADVSMIPGAWLDGQQQLGPFFTVLEGTVHLGTAGGEVPCLMAIGGRFRFLGFAAEYPIEVAVVPTLGRPYGLLSLRDIVRHFDIRSVPPLAATHVGRVELRPKSEPGPGEVEESAPSARSRP